VRQMRKVVDEYDRRLLIGEIYLPIEKLVTYYGDEESEAHLPFNFQLIGAPWDPDHIRSVVDTYEGSLRGHDWPNWVLGNHDKPRLASRTGREQAGIAAMLLLTLRGTPTLYYGDELGIVDGHIPPEEVRDPRELNCPGRGLGRDPARTPMQWGNGPSANFTRGVPWLPVNSDYREHNVSDQQQDEHSLLMQYHRLIELRRRESALAVGAYEPLETKANVLAYLRQDHTATFLVVLNFAGEPQSLELRPLQGHGQVEVSTHRVSELKEVGDRIELQPNEGILVRLASPPERPASSADAP
jgi:alpha-glucosidase